MEKDYYKILGITEDEKKLQGDDFVKVIKPKYRVLAMKYHPDKNPGDKEAESKFKDAAAVSYTHLTLPTILLV